MSRRTVTARRRCVLLHALAVLIVHRARLARRGGLGFGQGVVILSNGAMETLLKDGLRFVELELGLKVMKVVGVATTIGTATGIDEIELFVDDFFTHITPIALASAILLRLLGVSTLKAVLGKEFGKVVMRKDGALS